MDQCGIEQRNGTILLFYQKRNLCASQDDGLRTSADQRFHDTFVGLSRRGKDDSSAQFSIDHFMHNLSFLLTRHKYLQTIPIYQPSSIKILLHGKCCSQQTDSFYTLINYPLCCTICNMDK